MADEIKQEVLIDINLEQDEADFRKLASLKGILVGMKAEQKLLNDAFKAGQLTQKEYASEIVRVEALQKKATAQYSALQRTVTGLKSPFDKLNDSLKNQTKAIQGIVPGLDRMTGGAIGAAGAIFQMVKASLAFIATPIGLALTVAAAALAPFAAFLTKSGEGADLLTREMEGFRSVLQLVRDDLVKTGKEQKGFFEGMLAAISSTHPAIGALITSYQGLAQAGKDYADALDETQDAQEDFSVQAAKDENLIKRLLLQAKNRTLSEKERIELLERALTLESNLVTKRGGFAEKELSDLVERNRLRLEGIGIIQQESETQEEFVSNNISAIRDFDEALATSLIDSIKKLEEAKSSGIAIEEKAQTQLDTIRDKAEQKEIKRQEEAFKRSEEERKRRIEDYDAKLEQQEIELISDQEKAEFDAELDQIIKTGFEERLKKHEENKKKLKDQQLANDKKRFADQEKLQDQALATGLQFFGRNKAAASALTLVDTYLGAQKAFNSMLIAGDPTSFIRATLAAVLSTLQGLGRVAAINGIGFARGGYTGGGGVWEPAGIVHKGEVVWSQADVARAGGAEAVDRMRPTYQKNLTPYATGGIVGNETRLATQYATSQIDINQMAQLINQIQTVLVLEDFQAKEAEVGNLQRRATVIG